MERVGTNMNDKPDVIDEMMDAFRELKQAMALLANDMVYVRGLITFIEKRVEELVHNDGKHEAMIAATHIRLDKIDPIISSFPSMLTRVDQMEPKVNEHEAIKNKGLGIITVSSFLFGIIGAVVSKVLFGAFGEG